MADTLFFENVQTGTRYKIVKFDREAGTVTLTGRHNVQFDTKFDKAWIESAGYRLIRGDASAPGAAPPPPPPPVVVVASA